MHGISKKKHEHLIEALMVLEQLLEQKENTQEMGSDVSFSDTLKAIKEAKAELNNIFESYTIALESLAAIIKRYDELYNHSRTEYLAKVLKDLRRTTLPHGEQFETMRENIQIVYKT